MTTITDYATNANPIPHLFSDEQWAHIHQLLDKLDDHQSLWLSGFLAARKAPAAAPVNIPASTSKTLIVYGSETGNSEALAHKLGELLQSRNINYQLSSLADIKPRALSRVDYLLVICSTHGDGDPPEPAAPFYETLMSDQAPKLPDVKYAVLALGDSSYEHFCTTGVRLDERLEQLGGQRIVNRRECDVDFAKPADEWIQQVLAALPAAESSASPVLNAAQPVVATGAAKATYSKQNPLAIEVLENICLSDEKRESPVHHLELLLDQPDFLLEPGDAVGVLPHNPPALVAAVLDAAGLAGDEAIMLNERALPLVEALREHLDLTIPSQNFLTEWAQLSQDSSLQQQAEAETKLRREFLRSIQILDLLRRYPANPEAQQLVDNLRPLQPRLYDIANFTNPDTDELHLTVKRFRYEMNQATLDGIASDYLRQLQPGETVRVYPHHNKRFHLPDETDAPLILVASGTGIAPYRAFVQQILESARSHPCWLVFRERSFEEDFLYQVDWQQASAKGVLQKLDTAFYQDHPERTLADPLLEQMDTLSDWIERGAHLYLCGDKEPLTECEKALQLQYDARQESPAWKQLAQAKRIHRNLY